MRGRKNPDKAPTNNLLPPCRVCGEPGTGFHYGVNTCGACKGFFRRSLSRKDPYECIQSHLCHVGPSTNRRQSCPKCRYDKCIAMGMSKDACKVGRYTLMKKSTDIKEVINRRTQPSISSPPSFADKNAIVWQQNNQPEAMNGTYSRLGMLLYPPSQQEQYAFTKTPNVSTSSIDSNPSENASQEYMEYDEYGSDFSEQQDVLESAQITDSPYKNTEAYTSTISEEKYFPTANSEYSYDSRGNEYMSEELNSNVMGIGQGPSTPGEYNDPRSPQYTTLESSVPSLSTPKTYETPNSAVFNTDDENSLDCSRQNYGLASSPLFSSWDASPTLNTASYSPQNRDTMPSNPEFPQAFPFTNVNDSPVFVSTHNKTQQVSSTSSTTQDASPSQVSQLHSSTNDNITSNNNAPNNLTMCGRFPCSESAELVDPSDQSIHDNYSPLAKGISVCDTEANYTEFEQSGGRVMNTFKRSLDETDDENEPLIKKQHIAEIMEPDSSRQCVPQTTNAIVPYSGSRGTNDNPLVLYVVDPDPMKYVLSIFEQFPYKSFEKNSLAPLLKLCYDSNDWVESYLNQPPIRRNPLPCIDYLPEKPNVTRGTNACPSLSSAYSKGLLESTESTLGVTYDGDEMDKLLNYLQAIHCRSYGPESNFLTASESSSFMAMFKKICQLQESLVGKMNLIDEEKYYTVLETTGVDVDRRKEWFSCTFEGFDEVLTRDVKFLRAVPGFKDFSLKDRVTLIKSTAFVYTGLRHYSTVDVENDVCIDQNRGIASRLSNMLRILPGFAHVYDYWIILLKELKDLELSFEEFIVLKPLILIFPGYCEDLDNPQLAREWHNIYLNCLLHLVKKTHGPNAERRFKILFGILERMKDTRQPVKMAQISMKHPFEKLSEGQPLLTELFVNLPYQTAGTADEGSE